MGEGPLLNGRRRPEAPPGTQEFRPRIPSLATDYQLDPPRRPPFEGTSRVGPFERLDPNPGPPELVKTLFLAVTLLPLRMAAVLVIILAYYAVAAPCASAAAVSYARPRGKRRRRYGAAEYEVAGLLLRLLTRASARSVLFACGFHRIEVYGDGADSASDRGCAAIVVSNHVSLWEALYFLSSPCCPSFAFKSDCLRVPLIGTIALNVLRGVKIDRDGAGGGGTREIVRAVERMRDAGGLGGCRRPLLVFPEGTTGNGSSLLRFRSGAFVPGVAVRPVLINFPHERFSPAYESIYTTVLILRTLTQFQNRMQVRYLDKYVPSVEERGDARLFADNVRSVMARAGNLPLCDAGYREKGDYHKRLAKRLRSHPMGWLSNVLFVNPRPLPEEADMEPLVYRYSHPS